MNLTCTLDVPIRLSGPKDFCCQGSKQLMQSLSVVVVVIVVVVVVVVAAAAAAGGGDVASGVARQRRSKSTIFTL